MVSASVAWYSSSLLVLIVDASFFFVDKTRLAEERRELENEMKELKDTSGPRVRKVDVEEMRRKAARLGKVFFYSSLT